MKIIDMHCDTIFEIQKQNCNLRENHLHIDLKKLKQSNYLLQNFALYVPLKEFDQNHNDITPSDKNPLKEVLTLADCYYKQLEANQDIIAPVYTYKDIEKNEKSGKISALLTVEEGGVCLGSLSILRMLYQIGVRMMTLTWNFPNEIGYPNFGRNEKGIPLLTHFNTKDGLTETGFEFLEEMERLGMIIDVSHLSDAGFYDVYNHTKKPFVASHSNARTICSAGRNLTDDMIRKLSERGGVTGLNFFADFLVLPKAEKENIYNKETIETQKENTKNIDTRTTLKKQELNNDKITALINHAKHIVNVGGIECLGLGSDFDGIPTNENIPNATYMPQIYDRMKKAGFSENDLDNIFYKNVLRVYKDNF